MPSWRCAGNSEVYPRSSRESFCRTSICFDRQLKLSNSLGYRSHWQKSTRGKGHFFPSSAIREIESSIRVTKLELFSTPSAVSASVLRVDPSATILVGGKSIATNENLVSILPWVAYIVLRTIEACNSLMSTFASVIRLSSEITPGLHVFVRGPCNEALLEVLQIHSGASPWWDEARPES